MPIKISNIKLEVKKIKSKLFEFCNFIGSFKFPQSINSPFKSPMPRLIIYSLFVIRWERKNEMIFRGKPLHPFKSRCLFKFNLKMSIWIIPITNIDCISCAVFRIARRSWNQRSLYSSLISNRLVFIKNISLQINWSIST